MEVSRRVDVTDRGGRGCRSCGPPVMRRKVAGGWGLGLVRPGTRDLPPQDRNLMAQQLDLSILGCVTARQKRQPAEHLDHQQADRANEHERRS